MPQIKVILQKNQTATAVTGTSLGTAISLDGALTVSAQSVVSSVSSVAGASVILQVSDDASDVSPSNWNDYGSSQAITVAGNLFFEKANPSGNWLRMKYVTSSGSFNASTNLVVKGPN